MFIGSTTGSVAPRSGLCAASGNRYCSFVHVNRGRPCWPPSLSVISMKGNDLSKYRTRGGRRWRVASSDLKRIK